MNVAGRGWGGVCPSMYPSAPISSSTHVVVVAVIGVVVANVVLGSWIVLYERNKFSIENSYIVASRTITRFYCMVSDTIETICKIHT